MIREHFKGIFSGIRVVGCTQFVASTQATSLLADLGADVIKVEAHHRPDPGRVNDSNPGSFSVFPDGIPSTDWWNRSSFFNSLNRGQRSITLDLTKERGREVFRDLAKVSDVVLESFTPRVMCGWSLDYQSLRKVNPEIIMLSLTGFGHGNGPYTDQRGTATVLEATHGHAHVTGYEGGPPLKASIAFVDFVSAWTVVFGVAGALRHRHRTGKGQWLDLGLYQAGVMLLSEFLLDYQVNGRIGGRMGNRHPSRVQGAYRARGSDSWITISIGDDKQWAALCAAMGKPELKDDPDFATHLDRRKNHDKLDAAIQAWTQQLDKYELFHLLQQHRIPSAPVLDSRDLHTDPHLRARGFLQAVNFAPEREMEPRFIIGNPWQFSGETPKIRKSAPMLGEDNHAILRELAGRTEEDIASLEAEGVMSRELSGHPARKPMPASELYKLGILTAYDTDYRSNLPPVGEPK